MHVRLPRRRALMFAVPAALLGVALLVASRLGPVPAIPLPTVEPRATTLLAVGDIGSCDGGADELVASLASRLPGTIAILGDIAYPDGSAADFANCFDPAWGPMRSRMRPAPGNHEYQTTDASGYFSYFGAAAGTPGEGWYSYDLGAWHVVVLNSNCEFFVRCDEGSPQHAWLVADLAAHPATCTLAYWHHPRYSSGRHGDDPQTIKLWQALASAGADLVLVGHDHDYERIGRIDGLRSFVVGTGGRSLYAFERPRGAHTERRVNDSYGLLLLTLRDAGYAWRFVPAAGSTLVDAGTASCH